MMDTVHSNGGKQFWTIGWSTDVRYAMMPDQVQNFASQCVRLLEVAGDGIDLDFEHLNYVSAEQTMTMADILVTLRKELDAAGLHDKEISFAGRYNYFFSPNNRPAGWFSDDQEGLGVKIDTALK